MSCTPYAHFFDGTPQLTVQPALLLTILGVALVLIALATWAIRKDG